MKLKGYASRRRGSGRRDLAQQVGGVGHRVEALRRGGPDDALGVAEHERLGLGVDGAVGAELERARRDVALVVDQLELVGERDDDQGHGTVVDLPARAVVGRRAGRRLAVVGGPGDGGELAEELRRAGDEPEHLPELPGQRAVVGHELAVLGHERLVGDLEPVETVELGGGNEGHGGLLDDPVHL